MSAIKFPRFITTKLSRKYLLGMFSGLFTVSLVFLLLFMQMLRLQLEQERHNASTHVNQLLQVSLEKSMLERDAFGIQRFVDQLGSQKNIRRVLITNEQGDIRFSSTPLPLQQNLSPLDVPATAESHFLLSSDGQEVLRSKNPVANKAVCQECHGGIEDHAVNGMLVVDYDAAVIKKQSRKTTLALMGAGAIVVLITLSGGWWFMRRFVLRPVEGLVDAHRLFSDGDMTTRVAIQGEDELADMGNSFNRMASNIQQQYDAMAHKEHFLQSLLDGIPDGVRVLSSDGKILYANQSYADFTGLTLESLQHKYCYGLSFGHAELCVPTMINCPLERIAETGKATKVLQSHLQADGSQIAVEIFAAPLAGHGHHTQGIVEVIRNRAKMVEYSQEQRLSSIGELAAGVAHEIHNPLGSIRMALQSIDQQIRAGNADTERFAEYVTLVQNEIDNCIEVTGRLLKLSSSPSTALQLVDIDHAIRDTAALLAWEGDERHVRLNYDFCSPVSRTIAQDGELRMVFLNLIQNAYHAMPEGGTLTISTHRDAGDIVIEFSDTGCGIPKDKISRIFHPFYSNRADQEAGTGLGLAISKSIIDHFNGNITVNSEVGQGSVFTIQLRDADADDIIDNHTQLETPT